MTKVSLLSYNNAPAQSSRAEQAAVLKCGFEEVNHPPYFYGPTPSDWFITICFEIERKTKTATLLKNKGVLIGLSLI